MLKLFAKAHWLLAPVLITVEIDIPRVARPGNKFAGEDHSRPPTVGAEVKTVIISADFLNTLRIRTDFETS